MLLQERKPVTKEQRLQVTKVVIKENIPPRDVNVSVKKRKFEKLVYIKIPKTGSTTLQSIFYSYGYTKKIPLIIPRADGNSYDEIF